MALPFSPSPSPPPSPTPTTPPRQRYPRQRQRQRRSSTATTATTVPRPSPISASLFRTYSGQFGTGGPAQSPGGLLPLELSLNRNADWIDRAGYPLLAVYVGIILGIELALLLPPLAVPFGTSWTVTNVLHGAVSVTYLHWIKGSPDHLSGQGEMNGMTTWEQLVWRGSGGTPSGGEGRRRRRRGNGNGGGKWIGGGGEGDGGDCGVCYDDGGGCGEVLCDRRNQTAALRIVPTVLCHFACWASSYEPVPCGVNLAVWLVCVVAKLDRMRGVRLFGINRTVGVDA